MRREHGSFESQQHDSMTVKVTEQYTTMAENVSLSAAMTLDYERREASIVAVRRSQFSLETTLRIPVSDPQEGQRTSSLSVIESMGARADHIHVLGWELRVCRSLTTHSSLPLSPRSRFELRLLQPIRYYRGYDCRHPSERWYRDNSLRMRMPVTSSTTTRVERRSYWRRNVLSIEVQDGFNYRQYSYGGRSGSLRPNEYQVIGRAPRQSHAS